MQASRVKKMRTNYGYNKERTNEIWEDEMDDDNFMIIRLFYDEQNSYPWLVTHQGVHEVFKGPLFVPVASHDDFSNDKSVLILHLKDSANRGKKSIKRKFYLKFNSVSEAEGFKVTHKLMKR